jgi:hypothetical protein
VKIAYRFDLIKVFAEKFSLWYSVWVWQTSLKVLDKYQKRKEINLERELKKP